MIEKKTQIQFPEYSGVRCLMMPYIQGELSSVPAEYHAYSEIIESIYFEKGDIGFLTIDESFVEKSKPHRGARARHGRALHTEAGVDPNKTYRWGGWRWGTGPVELEEDVRVLLANNIDDTCALWNAEHKDTTIDGDIGHLAHMYPYEDAIMMKSGEVWDIGIMTPHESLPVRDNSYRQFLRIVSKGVHGREPYFTENPVLNYNH